LLLLTGMCTAATAEDAPYTSTDFDDPTVCAGCHAEIYKQWNGSMHSNAYTDPVYRKLDEMASNETDGLTDEYCIKCHSPIGYLTGEILPADRSNMGEISKKGVQCDFCHIVTAVSGINGAFDVEPGKVKRGPYDDSTPIYHTAEFSELHTSAEFCGGCHNVYQYTNNLPIEMTYDEWKASPYNTGDPETSTPCQHCHMTHGITHFEANPGVVASGGPERDHWYTHYFVGGNAPLPGILGSEKHSELAVERLQSAASLEMDIPENIAAGEQMSIDVIVTNTGAGHNLPTGLSEARQVWIDVTVMDSTGREIFRSGAIDENGHIDSGAVKFHTVFADADGNPTDKVWEMASIIEDTRIPPKESVTKAYTFTIPADVRTPITVSASLNYQTASQELIDSLFGVGQVIIPTIEMAKAEQTTGRGAEEAGGAIPGFGIIPAAVGFLAMYLLRSRRNQ
ncbi:MAG: cytochrome c family protein, partial [Nitrospiraceae bacterium]|nr:cytochrome c family protein [Nitrospiraceae bacterium]